MLATGFHGGAEFGEIRVEGQLDPVWADWLDGFKLSFSGQNETVLTGLVTDVEPFLRVLVQELERTALCD